VAIIEHGSVRGRDGRVRVKRPGDRRSLSRSATRALDVLELFAMARRPLRAVDIARALDIHASTANQLLKTMVDSAHLVFEARGKTYLPSPRLAGFGAWIVETCGADGRVGDLIGAVHAATGMTVTVTTPNDLFMQVIDLAVGDDRHGERGLRVPVFGSAIGSAYLSMLDDAEITRLAGRARIPAADVPAILTGAARIRHDGYADGAVAHSPCWSIAVPMPMRGLCVPTVLGLAGPLAAVRDDLPRLYGLMRAALA
jgi:DNA-binding IclR family transcriptional regulator